MFMIVYDVFLLSFLAFFINFAIGHTDKTLICSKSPAHHCKMAVRQRRNLSREAISHLEASVGGGISSTPDALVVYSVIIIYNSSFSPLEMTAGTSNSLISTFCGCLQKLGTLKLSKKRFVTLTGCPTGSPLLL